MTFIYAEKRWINPEQPHFQVIEILPDDDDGVAGEGGGAGGRGPWPDHLSRFMVVVVKEIEFQGQVFRSKPVLIKVPADTVAQAFAMAANMVLEVQQQLEKQMRSELTQAVLSAPGPMPTIPQNGPRQPRGFPRITG